jgi:hypothetical protein
MKNIFKSRFSLIAICIVLGILIGSFTLCGCRTNFGLLEGMVPNEKDKKQGATGGATGGAIEGTTEGTTEGITGGEQGGGGSIPSTPAIGDIAGGLAQLGRQLQSNPKKDVITNSIADALQTAIPLTGGKSGFTPTKENFQVSRPLGWKSIEDNESDDVNLSSWVSDAIKYSKGMGTEDRLNSLQYNSGPPIPLPEDQLFFFKDTKFNPSCCPSTYTSSTGCACMSKKQFQYLTQRGGNHTAPNNRTSYFNEF